MYPFATTVVTLFSNITLINSYFLVFLSRCFLKKPAANLKYVGTINQDYDTLKLCVSKRLIHYTGFF